MATARLRDLVSLDLRSLALFRVCLGGLLVADAAFKATEAEAFFTEAGVLPAHLLQWVSPHHAWSLCMLSDGLAWQLVLLGVLAVSGVALALGRASRFCIIVASVLLLSFRLRNPAITQIADDVLPLFLMWAFFMPVSERGGPGRVSTAPAGPSLSAGGVGFQLQVLLIYVAAGVYKSMSAPWVQGSILMEAMRIDPVATDFGRMFLDAPLLLYVAGRAAVPFELLGPFLLYVPWRNGGVRIATVGAFMAFHLLGIGLFMRLGLVPFVLAAAWTAFLPPAFWDRVLPRLRGRPEGVPSDRAPYRMGRSWDAVAVLVGVVSFGTYLRYLPVSLPEPVQHTAATLSRLGVGQQMFSLWTRPAGNRHFVFAATLADGTEVDLATGAPLDWSRPRRRLPDNHWYKLFQRLRQSDPIRRGVGAYFAQRWNDRHPPEQHVVALEVGVLQAKVRRPAWWLRQTDLRVEIPMPRTRWHHPVETYDGEVLLGSGLTIRDPEPPPATPSPAPLP